MLKILRRVIYTIRYTVQTFSIDSFLATSIFTDTTIFQIKLLKKFNLKKDFQLISTHRENIYQSRQMYVNQKKKGIEIEAFEPETDGIAKIEYRLISCTASIPIIPYRTVPRNNIYIPYRIVTA